MTRNTGMAPTTIDDIALDLLQNILARLPALSFASAACVSRSWNHVCDRVLSRPKLSSASLTGPTIQAAVEAVLNKVLSEPIRPHFAILFIGDNRELEEADDVITAKLGPEVPVVTCYKPTCMGRDSSSNEFHEWHNLNWNDLDDEEFDKRVMLFIGFLPGIKVKELPLLRPVEIPQDVMIDKFVTDIREFSNSISGCTSPAAIILFGQLYLDETSDVMEELDYALSRETIIVGDARTITHIHPHRAEGITMNITTAYAVALVFVVDRNKPPGIGETKFHAVISSGLVCVGPAYKVTSVKEAKFQNTTLTARREESHENLNGETILNQAFEELGRRTRTSDVYIGLTKRRQVSIGQEKMRWMTSLVFHYVFKLHQAGMHVFGSGIKTGDTFRIFCPDSTSALSGVDNVSNNLRSFKQGSIADGDKGKVFGGLIFSCMERDKSFFGQPNVDSIPFLDNFPGVTLGGSFGSRTIGRGDLAPYVKDSHEQKLGRCCMHYYGVVYLIMSYNL